MFFPGCYTPLHEKRISSFVVDNVFEVCTRTQKERGKERKEEEVEVEGKRAREERREIELGCGSSGSGDVQQVPVARSWQPGLLVQCVSLPLF